MKPNFFVQIFGPDTKPDYKGAKLMRINDDGSTTFVKNGTLLHGNKSRYLLDIEGFDNPIHLLDHGDSKEAGKFIVEIFNDDQSYDFEYNKDRYNEGEQNKDGAGIAFKVIPAESKVQMGSLYDILLSEYSIRRIKKTCRLVSVTCHKTSDGYDVGTKAAGFIIGAAVAAAAAVASAPATGGATLTQIGTAALSAGSTGAVVMENIAKLLSGTDELYVKINDESNKHGKTRDISNGQTHDYNNKPDHWRVLFSEYGGKYVIGLYEYDNGSADDLLGKIIIKDTHDPVQEEYYMFSQSENSIYSVRIEVLIG